MKERPLIDLGMTGYDELFMNDAERREVSLPKIYTIPLSEIDDFPDHPFQVRLDEDMDQLVESVKERGVITPITLRRKGGGRYEIVSGHRRRKACELAGLATVPAEIKELTRDEAIILMVESNLQRSTILPSEKAFSYKMRLEAMKRQQGERTDLTSVPPGQKLSTREIIAENAPDSNTQIQRYIEYEKRAMIEAEDKYTFRQSTQISMQTGLIGHLRADMDTDGNGFFSSWFDFREELKTDEFKAEFDEVINSLREEGDILHNRRTLAKYCYCTPQSRMQKEPGYYGVRVDTEKYAYLLRLNPNKGEYNLYCYCYRRDWLDQHMKDAEKGIRFIDSHYKELFRIPDGGKVKIHYSWNEDQIRTCRYIDDYHVEIGSNLYHICEFAERMEYSGHTCEPVRDNLPERCYSVLPSSGEIIIIKRGEKGYGSKWPAYVRLSFTWKKKRDKEGAMPSKYRMILDLASQTAKNITADADRYSLFSGKVNGGKDFPCRHLSVKRRLYYSYSRSVSISQNRPNFKNVKLSIVRKTRRGLSLVSICTFVVSVFSDYNEGRKYGGDKNVSSKSREANR